MKYEQGEFLTVLFPFGKISKRRRAGLSALPLCLIRPEAGVEATQDSFREAALRLGTFYLSEIKAIMSVNPASEKVFTRVVNILRREGFIHKTGERRHCPLASWKLAKEQEYTIR